MFVPIPPGLRFPAGKTIRSLTCSQFRFWSTMNYLIIIFKTLISVLVVVTILSIETVFSTSLITILIDSLFLLFGISVWINRCSMERAAILFTLNLIFLIGFWAVLSFSHLDQTVSKVPDEIKGSGKIFSQPGSLIADPGFSGEADFSFDIPGIDAYVRYQLKSANIDFVSREGINLLDGPVYVIRSGDGTLNGKGNYGYLLTIEDGDLPGGNGQDKLGFKIVDYNSSKEKVVYDSKAGVKGAELSLISEGDIVRVVIDKTVTIQH